LLADSCQQRKACVDRLNYVLVVALIAAAVEKCACGSYYSTSEVSWLYATTRALREWQLRRLNGHTRGVSFIRTVEQVEALRKHTSDPALGHCLFICSRPVCDGRLANLMRVSCFMSGRSVVALPAIHSLVYSSLVVGRGLSAMTTVFEW